MGIAALMFVIGVSLTGLLIIDYVRHDFLLADGDVFNYLGVTGLFLLIAGFMTFTFTLLLHSTAVVVWRK